MSEIRRGSEWMGEVGRRAERGCDAYHFGERDSEREIGRMTRGRSCIDRYEHRMSREFSTYDELSNGGSGRMIVTSFFLHAINIGRLVDELAETDARSGDSSISGVTVCHFWAVRRGQRQGGEP